MTWGSQELSNKPSLTQLRGMLKVGSNSFKYGLFKFCFWLNSFLQNQHNRDYKAEPKDKSTLQQLFDLFNWKFQLLIDPSHFTRCCHHFHFTNTTWGVGPGGVCQKEGKMKTKDLNHTPPVITTVVHTTERLWTGLVKRQKFHNVLFRDAHCTLDHSRKVCNFLKFFKCAVFQSITWTYGSNF